MKTIFKHKKISSILSILPETEIRFDDEIVNYKLTNERAIKFKRTLGLDTHRIAKDTTAVSDFACYGLKYMLDKNWIKKDEIGAIVVVSICPDYFLPHISNIVHGELDLPRDILCLDISQACCGYLQGLMESFMILEHINDKKVVLINGDVSSRSTNKNDTNFYPMIGDGAAISVIENDYDNIFSDIYFELNIDGKRRDVLKVEAGGFRKRPDETTKIVKDRGNGVKCAEEQVYMDGLKVFNFVISDVAQMITRIFSENNINDIDYFYFHQPNIYLLKQLINMTDIPLDKAPINLVTKYGNMVSASIPAVIALNNKNEMTSKVNKCFLSAFGAGLAYGCAIMDIGKLNHIEEIISNL